MQSTKGLCEASVEVYPDDDNDNASSASASDDGTKGTLQDQGQDNDEARTVEEILGSVIDLVHVNQQQIWMVYGVMCKTSGVIKSL